MVTNTPKVAFLEKQSTFRWHAGMQLPGATMQISWIKDFATMRNPRSSFTFLNYLWTVGRLLQFSNLGTFLPTRLEYEAYMKWVAGWFTHLVQYNQECIEIVPEETGAGKKVRMFVVKSRNLATGEIETRRTRHAIIACGGKPFIPSNFPQNSQRVIHSSSYMLSMPKAFPDREQSYRFVVIGSGQSAAETFHDLQTRYPNCQATLMIRQSTLRPSDDSPFVNETFHPEHVDDLFEIDDDVRKVDIVNDRPTNYGVVRLELLDAIYHDLYMQRVRYSDPKDWQHRILPFREVTSIQEIDNQIRLQISNTEPLHRKGGRGATADVMDADGVIVAAGYQRNAHEDLLSEVKDLQPHGEHTGWKVRRDYSVIFRDGVLSEDIGIWLQGSNEGTHGLSDTLLSILAVRGQEVVDSIFASRRAGK